MNHDNRQNSSDVQETAEAHILRRRRALAQRYGQKMTETAASDSAVRQVENAVMMAQRHGIESHTSPELTTLLSTVTPDAQMPPELQQAVASVVTWLHQIETDVAPPKD